MFVRESVQLPVGIETARARLANLIGSEAFMAAAQQTYTDGITGRLRVGPHGSTPVLSRLVEVSFRDLVSHGDQVLLTLRWKAVGPGGALFPVLDADITLTPGEAGRQDDAEATRPGTTRSQTTELRLDGAYRPPFGAAGAGLDRAILHRVATATIRAFVTQVADAIASPAPAPAAGQPDQALASVHDLPST